MQRFHCAWMIEIQLSLLQHLPLLIDGRWQFIGSHSKSRRCLWSRSHPGFINRLRLRCHGLDRRWWRWSWLRWRRWRRRSRTRCQRDSEAGERTESPNPLPDPEISDHLFRSPIRTEHHFSNLIAFWDSKRHIIHESLDLTRSNLNLHAGSDKLNATSTLAGAGFNR